MQAGVWHTGTPTKVIAIQHEDYFTVNINPSGQYNYTKYTVEHNGDCGFQSFIPIMLDYLLQEDRHSKWLENTKTNFLDKAAGILSNNTRVQNQYTRFAPDKDRDSSYEETTKLLGELKSKKPRKLQPDEIEKLVCFLRHLMLCKQVIKEKDPLASLPFHPEVKKIFDALGQVKEATTNNETLTKLLEGVKNNITLNNSTKGNKDTFNQFLKELRKALLSLNKELAQNKDYKLLHQYVKKDLTEDVFFPLAELVYETKHYGKHWWIYDDDLLDLDIPNLTILYEKKANPYPLRLVDHQARIPKIMIKHRPSFFDYIVRHEP